MLTRFWSSLNHLIRSYFLDYFFVLVVSLLLLSWLQSSYTLPEPDSFYHAKIAEFISQGKIIKQLPWLQQTPLKASFVDQHFLYHIFLAPFVKLANPLIAVKIATIIFASLLVLAVYWLLKKFQLKYPAIFIIILLSVKPWLFRVGLVKAPAVFLIFLLIGFYALTHRKKFLLSVVSFASVWLYAGWPLLLAAGVLYALVVIVSSVLRQAHFNFSFKLNKMIYEPEARKKINFALSGLKYVFGGMILGLIINPYFPGNLLFYWEQFVKIAVVNYQNVIGVGGEWYPYGFFNLLADAPIIISCLIVDVLLFGLSLKKQSTYSWTWGILSLTFFLLTLKSRRYVEIFVPLTIVFTAFCFSDFYRSGVFFKIWHSLNKLWHWAFGSVAVLIAIIYLISLPGDWRQVLNYNLNGLPLNYYQKASWWLRDNTPAHSIVFNADWDDFPMLFYNDDHNFYLTGLDPTFMYLQDQNQYWLYVAISQGSKQTALAKTIKEHFNADYVFLDLAHKDFDRVLKADRDFRQVYKDDQAEIYQILQY